MRRPAIEHLRRLALGVALGLLVVIAASYAVRSWRAYRARRAVKTVIAADVKQQAESFTFSRSEAGRTVFTISAARTVERRGQQARLEEVSVVVYGQEENRADEIHTGRCEYQASAGGRIFCPEAVTFALGVAPPVKGVGSKTERQLRIQTARVQFDQASGAAWTAEPVEFSFPEGHGRGVGLRYQPVQPVVRLQGGVVISLARARQPPVTIVGQRLEYDSQQRVLTLWPPLKLLAGDRKLTAGVLRLQLDPAYRLRGLQASAGVSASTQPGARAWRALSQQARAEFAPGHGIERLQLSEQVRVESLGPSRETLTCAQAEIFFDPTHRWVERVQAAGAARLRMVFAQETRELAADKLELEMHPRGRAAARAATESRGTLTSSLANGEQRQVVGDHIELQFDTRSRLQGLAASGNVATDWQEPGQPPRRTWSAELRAEFDPRGELAAAEQWGSVRFREQELEAVAGRARFVAEHAVFVLTEKPALWDATLRLTAQRIEISPRNARLAALGDVRTSYQGRDAKPVFGSGQPVHLVAERMEGDRRRAWARYQGQARLWQGENRLQADVIELFENPRKLLAAGRVTSLLVVQGREAGEKSVARRLEISSEQLTYLEAERRALYEQEAVARAHFATLTAPRLEVFLEEAAAGGSAQVERVHASGGVVVTQPGRRAVAEHGEYTVADETLVLWGGEAQLIDAAQGSTTGARLTFNLANDSILVESATGSRSVTRRSWN